jgi:hypothetical protein
MDLMSNAWMSHGRPDFGIRSVIIGCAEFAVTEEIAS